jgi:hypothetical protein
MAKITIDEATKIVTTAQIRFAKGFARIDFARDTVLILDARTGAPLATCHPLEGAAEARKVALEARPPEPCEPAVPIGAPGRGYGGGRLSEAQEEWLQRAWANNPDIAPDKIGERFEKQFGRQISVERVLSRRPAANGKAWAADSATSI